MRHNAFTTTAVRHMGHTVTAIYHMGRLVWQSAQACFSRGWNNNLPWHSDAGWSND